MQTILTLIIGSLLSLALLTAIRQRSWVVQVMTLLLLTSVMLSVSTAFWVVDQQVSTLTLIAAVVLMAAPMQQFHHLMQLTMLLTIHMISPALSATISLGLLTLMVLTNLCLALIRQQDWSLLAGLLLLCLLSLPAPLAETFVWFTCAMSWWLIIRLAGQPPVAQHNPQPHHQSLEDAEAIRSAERSRIYQNIHDDVGADLLKLVYQTEDDQQRQAIKNVMSRLRHAVAKTEHRHMDLTMLMEEIRQELQASCEAAGLEFQANIDVRPISMTHELPVHLQRMVRELTSNCIKHAQATGLIFTAIDDEDHLLITIRDDGIGLPANAQNGTGKGLTSMRRRANKHGATIDWTAAPDQGTTVNLKVPLK